MKWHGSDIRLSASELMRFMSSAHASFLDLERLHDRGPDPTEDSEDAALPQSLGDCRYAGTRGTFSLTSPVWEEGDVRNDTERLEKLFDMYTKMTAKKEKA